MLNHAILFILSFIGIWIGSGIAVKSVQKISINLKISSFIISFIVLGLFTSISEFSVGVNAIVEKDPEIFVGTLIGASIVLFLLVIPLLAIVGRSISISAEFRGYNLPASLTVIALPVMLVLDGQLNQRDGIIALVLFFLLLVNLQIKKGVIERLRLIAPKTKIIFYREIVKILLGILIIYGSSHLIVEQTLYFSNTLNISPFLISLLAIAIGTNIPELSLVIRSAFIKNNQIAFGDYIGSAVFNTFLFGLLTVVNGETIILNNSYVISIIFLLIGLIAFYYFARTKNTISQSEGIILFGLYTVFLLIEYALHANLTMTKGY